MINEQLVGYLRQQLIAGFSKEDIRKAALTVGWQPLDISEAFTAIEEMKNDVPEHLPLTLERPVTPPVTVQTPPIVAPSPTPFTAPAPVIIAKSKHSFLILTVIGCVCLVLLIGGGVAYAYFQKIGPFSMTQYTEATFLTDVLAKSSQINAASYTVSVALAVDPRDQDAVAFVVPAPDSALEARYQNDSRKMFDMSSIVSGLRSKYGESQAYDRTTRQYVTKAGKPFPTTLSSTEMRSLGYNTHGTDPLTQQPYSYAATEGGKNFALTTTFETSAAISTIRKSYGYTATTTIIKGQKVTFTKNSGGYMYFPSTSPQPFFVMFADSLRSLPPDVSGTVAVGATTGFSEGTSSQWRFNATMDGSFGDLFYKVDVEALKKDANYYVRINKMPALPFLSFSNYKGQWIVITPSAASSTYGQYFNEFSRLASTISTTTTDYKQARADATEALKNVARLADKEKLFVFKTAPTKESVGGKNLYRYQLDVRKEAIIPFYKDMLTEVEKYKKIGITQDQGLLEYLQSKEFDDVFAYVKNNIFLTLWIDTNGFPAILEYRMRVVPPNTAVQLKGKQIDLIFKLTLTDINKSVNIDAPKDVRPVEDVIKELENNVGDSLSTARAKGADAAVQSDLDSIRTEAEIYYGNDNTYGTQAWVSGVATSCTGGMFKDATITKALAAVDKANKDGKKVACYAYRTGYLVGAELTTGGWWCIDSSGRSTKETGSMPTKAPTDKQCP